MPLDPKNLDVMEVFAQGLAKANIFIENSVDAIAICNGMADALGVDPVQFTNAVKAIRALL